MSTTTEVTETCSCGARITVKTNGITLPILNEWRVSHLHCRDRGNKK